MDDDVQRHILIVGMEMPKELPASFLIMPNGEVRHYGEKIAKAREIVFDQGSKKSTEEMIAVMQAFAEGKPIEIYYNDEYGWERVNHPTWDWLDFDYRIAEEVAT